MLLWVLRRRNIVKLTIYCNYTTFYFVFTTKHVYFCLLLINVVKLLAVIGINNDINNNDININNNINNDINNDIIIIIDILYQ